MSIDIFDKETPLSELRDLGWDTTHENATCLIMVLCQRVEALQDRIEALEGSAAGAEATRSHPPIDPDPDPDLMTGLKLQDGLNDKATMVAIARDLNIDDAIRMVAKSGKNHDHSPNWYVDWDGLIIDATFGAGIDSASVQIIAQSFDNLNIVYQASDYGRHIETFRYGPWVHRLLAHANELSQANEGQARIDEADEAQRDAAKFQEVDF